MPQLRTPNLPAKQTNKQTSKQTNKNPPLACAT
jgi:hypothetical protein